MHLQYASGAHAFVASFILCSSAQWHMLRHKMAGNNLLSSVVDSEGVLHNLIKIASCVVKRMLFVSCCFLLLQLHFYKMAKRAFSHNLPPVTILS